ncbi:MAG: hypothetical protein M1826_000831 [Phylliscum demangeonii]|nr:MAG: hypothetical protein M1826_000831 [Phylliscum demangeonii]
MGLFANLNMARVLVREMDRQHRKIDHIWISGKLLDENVGYLPSVLDRLRWLVFVEPIMVAIYRTLRPQAQPLALAFDGLLSTPLHERQQADIRRLGLLAEIARGFGEVWPQQSECLFQIRWLLQFVLVALPSHLSTHTMTVPTIVTIARLLFDPALPHRGRLDDIARELHRRAGTLALPTPRPLLQLARWPSPASPDLSVGHRRLLGLLPDPEVDPPPSTPTTVAPFPTPAAPPATMPSTTPATGVLPQSGLAMG